MSELSSIKSQALTERIEERLFAYILDNHLNVGAKLPNEHELAAHFEVSRGTVREAVKLLVSRGVLRVKHGSGTYVASLFPLHANPLGLDAVEDKLQLALDLTDVRLMLEPTIAALAAQNRTDEEVEQLAEYCDAVREKIEAGEDYLIEDMRFHWFLAKCSHNMVVEPLMPIIDAAVISIANNTRFFMLTAQGAAHHDHRHAQGDTGRRARPRPAGRPQRHVRASRHEPHLHPPDENGAMRLSRLSRNYSFADKCVLTSQNTDVRKFPCGNFLPLGV